LGSCADLDETVAVDTRVAHGPQLPLHCLVLDLFVTQGRAAARAPVDDVTASIDEPLLEQSNEDLAHGPTHVRVEREVLARPIERPSDTLHLFHDVPVRTLLPAPAVRDELVALETRQIDPLVTQLALHDLLGRDPGVIGAGPPECLAPAHALIAYEDVLDRARKHVPHVQRAGDVGWRQQHDVRLGVAVAVLGAQLRAERICLQPALAPARLDLCRIVRTRGNVGRHTLSRSWKSLSDLKMPRADA
jgi:hypothetical protein